MKIIKLRYPLKILLLVAAVLTSMHASASHTIIVVANVDAPIKLSKSEVKTLFLGGSASYDLKAFGLIRAEENTSRALFNARIIGMTEARIESYWAQMRFSGRRVPIKEFDNVEKLLQYLSENKGTAGYVSEGIKLNENLRVIYRDEN